MSQMVAFMADAPRQGWCQYTGTKIDVEVLRLVRAACALRGIRMQDWLSDLANEAASKELGRKPLKRKPIKPRED